MYAISPITALSVSYNIDDWRGFSGHKGLKFPQNKEFHFLVLAKHSTASANGFSTFFKTVSDDERCTDPENLGGGRNGLFQKRIADEEPVLANASSSVSAPLTVSPR